MAGHVAMEDHEPPSFESLSMAVDFIDREVRARKPVLVHCLAGEGRTGCALAAYMVRVKGLGADEAMAKVREAKPQFVEWRQEKSVREFAESVGA